MILMSIWSTDPDRQKQPVDKYYNSVNKRKGQKRRLISNENIKVLFLKNASLDLGPVAKIFEFLCLLFIIFFQFSLLLKGYSLSLSQL